MFVGGVGAYWALHSKYPVIRTLSIRLARLSEDVFTDTSKYCGGSVPSMPLIVVRMASTTCVRRPRGSGEHTRPHPRRTASLFVCGREHVLSPTVARRAGGLAGADWWARLCGRVLKKTIYDDPWVVAVLHIVEQEMSAVLCVCGAAACSACPRRVPARPPPRALLLAPWGRSLQRGVCGCAMGQLHEPRTARSYVLVEALRDQHCEAVPAATAGQGRSRRKIIFTGRSCSYERV